MAFTTDLIKKGKEDSPRKIVLYGPPKIGKSSLAAAAAGTLVIQTEDRLSHIDCDKTPVVGSMADVYDVLTFLSQEKHGYKNLVIDTIDWLEPLIHDDLCKKNGWKSITDDHNKDTNYFKGLKYHAVAAWREFLDNLDYLRNNKKISIILVSHSMKVKEEPADSENYDREVMKIDKNSVYLIEEWADVIGYYNRDLLISKGEKQKSGKVISGDKRILNLGGDNPSFISGNSFGFPDRIEVNVSDLKKIMEYLLKGDSNKMKNQEVKNG